MILDDRSDARHVGSLIVASITAARCRLRVERLRRVDRNDVREKCEVTEQDGEPKAGSLSECDIVSRNVPFPQTDEAAFPKLSNLDRAEESCT
jgi:hypothetical protein